MERVWSAAARKSPIKRLSTMAWLIWAASTTVAISPGRVQVNGPLGELSQDVPARMQIEKTDTEITVTRPTERGQDRALHGLTRTLIANMVEGVTKGFEKHLEIQGVGYRAQLAGKAVNFTLGYTHPIDFPIPDGIQIAVDKQTKLTVTGIDRQKVGQVAAKIRSLRPPDVYKGKGIRYAGEQLRKKAGKTGAK